jgi:Fe2+ or Zn2+ uptake regulation protein
MTPAQLDILKLVSSFDGQFSPYGVQSAMKTLSGVPESEWAPIRNQLNLLEDLGLIRPEITEIGLSKYRITDRGRKLLGG